MLILSLFYLFLWKYFDQVYSKWILLIPVFIVLSIVLCIFQRIYRSKIRKNYSFWGSILFHIGMIIVICSFFVSPFVQLELRGVLPKGVQLESTSSDFFSVQKSFDGSKIPFFTIKFTDETYRYDDSFALIEYKGEIALGYNSGDVYNIYKKNISVNEPIHSKNYQVMLLDTGESPQFTIKDIRGNLLFNSYLTYNVNYLDEMSFKLAETGVTLFLRLFPDLEKLEDGTYTTKSAYLNNPAFGVKVVLPDKNPFKTVYSGIMKVGDAIEVDDYVIEFSDLRRYMDIQVNNDPTYHFLFLGWILMVAGLILRYSTAKMFIKLEE